MAGPVERDPRRNEVAQDGKTPGSQVLSGEPHERKRGARGGEAKRKNGPDDQGAMELKGRPPSRPADEEVCELKGTPASHDAVLDLQLNQELSPNAGRH